MEILAKHGADLEHQDIHGDTAFGWLCLFAQVHNNSHQCHLCPFVVFCLYVMNAWYLIKINNICKKVVALFNGQVMKTASSIVYIVNVLE